MDVQRPARAHAAMKACSMKRQTGTAVFRIWRPEDYPKDICPFINARFTNNQILFAAVLNFEEN
jgi:hypothetical protein